MRALVSVGLLALLGCEQRSPPLVIQVPDGASDSRTDGAEDGLDARVSDAMPQDAALKDMAARPPAELDGLPSDVGQTLDAVAATELGSSDAEVDLAPGWEAGIRDATPEPPPEEPARPVRWDVMTQGSPFFPCGLTGGRLECLDMAVGNRWPPRVVGGGERIFEDDHFWLPQGQFKAVGGSVGLGCAIDLDNHLSCWGWLTDVVLTPEDEFAQVAGHRDYLCGIRLDGTLLCWGDRGGARAAVFQPPPGRFLAINLGGGYPCGLRDTGDIACWGTVNFEEEIEGEFITLDANGCRITAQGEIVCKDFLSRFPPPPGRYHQAIAVYDGEICALSAEDSHAVCWGPRTAGGLPQDGYVAMPPVPLRQLTAAPGGHCGLDFDGFVWCWGSTPHNPYTLRP